MSKITNLINEIKSAVEKNKGWIRLMFILCKTILLPLALEYRDCRKEKLSSSESMNRLIKVLQTGESERSKA